MQGGLAPPAAGFDIKKKGKIMVYKLKEIFLFPMYFMFVIVEAVLCWIAFGFYVSKKR